MDHDARLNQWCGREESKVEEESPKDGSKIELIVTSSEFIDGCREAMKKIKLRNVKTA